MDGCELCADAECVEESVQSDVESGPAMRLDKVRRVAFTQPEREGWHE